jgi:hypothetical protein
MKKIGFKRPKVKPTNLKKAFDMPKGPKGPNTMKTTAPPSPFGRVKQPRGTFGPSF